MARSMQDLAVLFANLSERLPLPEDDDSPITLRLEQEWVNTVSAMVPGFGGRVASAFGDSMMCVFPSAEQGAQAASAIQAAVSPPPLAGLGLEVKMGLHFGNTFVEGDDIYGEPVNIAAYLAAIATPGQIATTDAVHKALPEYLKSLARPIFRTTFKGQNEESVVYEVLWRPDKADVTASDFNARGPGKVPTDDGGLLLKYRDKTLRIDSKLKHAVIGRHSTSNLQIQDAAASRYHACIELRGVEFYLNDISINGTFVISGDKPEVHVLRRDIVLEGAGRICLGRSFKLDPAEVIEFSRDRRSLFRI